MLDAIQVVQASCLLVAGSLGTVAVRLTLAELRARAVVLLRVRRVGGLTFMRVGRFQASFCRVRGG